MLVKAKNIRYTGVVKFETEIQLKARHLHKVFATVETVRNETDKAILAAGIKEGKQLIKRVGEARKNMTAPLQQEVKRWIAKEKELVAPIQEAVNKADQLVKIYNQSIVEKQALALAQIEAEAQKQLEEGSKDSTLVRQESELKRQVTYAKHTTEGVRKVWTFEAENLARVPREYMMLDTQKIRQAIRNGKRLIPGLKIYQKTQTFYR